MSPGEELLFRLSDFAIDQLYTRGCNAGRHFAIGRENQTPLEAAQEAGWREIHTFDTRLTIQQGAVGISQNGELLAITDSIGELRAINIIAEHVLEAEGL